MRRFIVAWAISSIALLSPVCVSAEVQNNDLIAHKIHDVLKQSGRMSGSSFVIKCQDGTAWLEGRVNSEEQKALALKLTGEVQEISEVVDHLRVEPRATPKSAAAAVAKSEPAEASDDAVEAAETTEAEPVKSHGFSWLSRPAVKAAASKPASPITSHHDQSLNNDAAYPESLDASESAESSNPLVRQVANLKTIFRRQSPAPRPMATESGNQPRAVSHSSQCATCNAGTRSSKGQARQVSQNQPTQAGRVRMVPMMELPDGRLVPVQQVNRAPLGQPIAGQQASPQSRAQLAAARKTRTNVARRQEVIDGEIDGVPAAPVVPGNGGPLPAYVPGVAAGVAPAYYDQPHMPNYAWPSYAAHPNYAGVTYPRQYSPTAWPYIGPFYPYPQVPLGWRKVTLEWDDGWWFLDFDDTNRSYAY